MSRSPQEEAAHRYADHGWFVFPAAPGSKIPITEHGYLDATTGHKQIQNWWRGEPQAPDMRKISSVPVRRCVSSSGRCGR